MALGAATFLAANVAVTLLFATVVSLGFAIKSIRAEQDALENESQAKANDGGAHGWYMLLQPRDGGIEASWHRLEYDFETSRDSTIAAGMSAYGEALASGLWPSIDILPEAEARQTGYPLDPPPLFIEAAGGACATAEAASA